MGILNKLKQKTYELIINSEAKKEESEKQRKADIDANFQAEIIANFVPLEEAKSNGDVLDAVYSDYGKTKTRELSSYEVKVADFYISNFEMNEDIREANVFVSVDTETNELSLSREKVDGAFAVTYDDAFNEEFVKSGVERHRKNEVGKSEHEARQLTDEESKLFSELNDVALDEQEKQLEKQYQNQEKEQQKELGERKKTKKIIVEQDNGYER